MAFFDAIAPIVHADSINMDIAWFQSRYDKTSAIGDGRDYINCPMTKEQYEHFLDEMLAGENVLSSMGGKHLILMAVCRLK